LPSASRCEHRVTERATADAEAPSSSSASTAASSRASQASTAVRSRATAASWSHNPDRSAAAGCVASALIQSSNTRTSSGVGGISGK